MRFDTTRARISRGFAAEQPWQNLFYHRRFVAHPSCEALGNLQQGKAMSLLLQKRSTKAQAKTSSARRSALSGWTDRRGVVAIEFAFVAVPFFIVLFFIFEISIDLFEQELLDAGLHMAARQVQTGNAQNVTNGTTFINTYLCPDVGNLLTCTNLYVNVDHITPKANQDYYNFTTGKLPESGGALDLSSYGSANFCNAGPSEFLLISAIYVSPSLIGGFLPNILSIKYNGHTVHATLSQVAGFSEGFPTTAAKTPVAPSC
jgi:hypothetical protein